MGAPPEPSLPPTPPAGETAQAAAAEISAEAEAKPESESSSEEATHIEGNELPSSVEQRRAQVTKRLHSFMDNLQSKLFVASQHINDLTGYSSIDGLKRSIIDNEQRLADAKEEVRVQRANYKQMVADRAASQREVTTLLARKDSWTPIDLERFTNLYRSDHGNEHAVQEVAQNLADVERAAEQAASKLNSSILARYHEEQIWSDKIRRMSTWGTWGLMSVNVLLFLVFQFGFEPWRRERLTRGFEDKVKMALEREREIAQIESAKLATEQKVAKEALEAAAPAVAAPAVAAAVETSEGEDVVAETVPELIAAIEEFARDQVPEPEVITEADAIPQTETEVGAPVDPGIKIAAEPEAPLPAAEPGFKPITFIWDKPETWREGVYEPAAARFQDLFGPRKVELKMLDITMVALEGVATGAAIATIVALYILRPN